MELEGTILPLLIVASQIMLAVLWNLRHVWAHVHQDHAISAFCTPFVSSLLQGCLAEHLRTSGNSGNEMNLWEGNPAVQHIACCRVLRGRAES